MYFFSETDPNYRIKGSRDPLGFQTLWANAGHRAVAHLSTVSSGLMDFMILAYGIYFYANRAENKFLNFFLKFEQVCAYARRICDLEGGFNGSDFVNKKRDEVKFSISLNPSDMLLSNQRTYGIYGKYIRPFRDMGISDDTNFNKIIEQSLCKTEVNKVLLIVEKLLNTEILVIQREELHHVADLLKTLTPSEKELYRETILKVKEISHPQNNLYQLISNNRNIAKAEFNLHSTLQVLINEPGISPDLKTALENIQYTDRVLYPLNRCFIHLLGQSSWTTEQLSNDSFIGSLPGAVKYDFQDETMRKLNKILDLEKISLAREIIARNEEVSSQRGSKGWIIKEKDIYKIIYGENGQKQRVLDFTNGYEFPYFINTYLNLFRQIEIEK